jgi:uncharacterized protein
MHGFKMISDLHNLLLLQHADSGLKHAETALADAPRRKAELAERLAIERKRLDEAKAALDESQRLRRQREGELQSLEAKRSKYKGQLMDVKTNKEYTAMLHEIETVERDVRACEDQILVEMERTESLTVTVKHEEADFKQTDAAFKLEARKLDAEVAQHEREAAALRAERDQLLGQLSDAARDLFTRVAKLRGSAVSEARDTMCQACRMKLRPQMYMELRHNDRIQQCPSCSRILVYTAPPPVVDVQF